MTPEEARQREAEYRAQWETEHTLEEIAERDRLEQQSRDSWAQRKNDPRSMAIWEEKIAELNRRLDKANQKYPPKD